MTAPAGRGRLVDIDGAADYLAVSPRFIRRLIAERRIEHHKIGRYIRFDTATLDEWIEERTVPAHPAGTRATARVAAQYRDL